MKPIDPETLSFAHFEESLASVQVESRRRSLRSMSVDGVHLITDDGTRLLNFGGNDYLGVVADQTSSDSFGARQVNPAGASASALVCGWTPHHARLAESIARLERTEAAVVFPSGYAACSGTVATLCRQGDWILSDSLNHASLIDGCRASKATRQIYPHRDVAYVENCLREQRDQFNEVWMVTDGVFSMDGDIAPLHDLVEMADRYGARLIVDEAHGTGVLGDRGGGLCEAMGLQEKISIRIGTLSKAIGHQGGFVAGPQVVIDYLINFCRPLIFSTSLSPAVAAGAADVVDRLADSSLRREHVRGLSSHLRRRLGIPAEGIESGIPIVPVLLGGNSETVQASQRLREAGFFVPAIRPPTVPEGSARLRVSLSAAHTVGQVDHLAKCLAQANYSAQSVVKDTTG